jgi:hypothetical protein
MAQLKAKDGEGSGGNRGRRGRGNGKRDGRGGGGGRGSPSDSNEEMSCHTKPTDVCRACGKLGHWVKVCRSKPKKAAQTNVVEEDESGLLLAEIVEIQNLPSPPAAEWVPAPAPARRAIVHFIEERVFTQIGVEGEAVDTLRWVVNTRATNPMIGASGAFSELDTGICGIV